MAALTVRQWRIIDRKLDNDISIQAVGGDPAVVGLSTAVRHAVWEQTTGWRPGMPPRGWPPDDDVPDVSLTAEQWERVAASLATWEAVADDAAEVAEIQEIRRLIRDRNPRGER